MHALCIKNGGVSVKTFVVEWIEVTLGFSVMQLQIVCIIRCLATRHCAGANNNRVITLLNI